VRFPVRIKHRTAEATIYAKSANYGYYRVKHYAQGRRHVRSFTTYAAARAAAEKTVRDIASGSAITALTPGQARDALAAFERLDAFYKAKGKRVSLNTAVGEFVEAAGKLNGVTLAGAVEGYLHTVATVKRMDVSAAVEEFIAAREAKTQAKDGKRAQLSASYANMTAAWLRQFAAAFPGNAVADLTKEHLDLFMAKRGKEVAAKSRNHIRATVRMFLAWCVRKDYQPANHRLFEADGLARETFEAGETDFYRPAELRALLDAADTTLLPIIALCALAGLRQQEAMRLTWQDVFGTPGHVTITATKSKTRSRRLVEICPSLSEWLRPYCEQEGPLWTQSRDTFHAQFAALRASRKIPARKNGLRHGFCTYHFALHSNENLTAAQAGNSPAMIHAHYKGLATKAEAAKWFNVLPPDAATNVIPLSAASRKQAH
jgi:integrase